MIEKAQEGCLWARNRLICDNLESVVQFLSKQYPGMDFHELLSSGCLGMVMAIEKFDTSRGIRLISYAVYWIRYVSQKQVNEDRTVRLPVDVLKLQKKMYWGMSEKEGSFDFDRTMGKRVDLYLRHGISLDQLEIEDDKWGVKTLHDILEDHKQRLPDREIEEREMKKHVLAVVETLCQQERDVIQKYYGLYDQKPLTLQEIGESHGVTRERICQIRNKALVRMVKRLHRRGITRESLDVF